MNKLHFGLIVSALLVLSGCNKTNQAEAVGDAGDNSAAALDNQGDILAAAADNASVPAKTASSSGNKINMDLPTGTTSTISKAFMHEASEYTVGRDYLYGHFFDQKADYAKGVVLLKKGASKNKMFCKYFVRNIAPSQQIREFDPAAKIIPTYWLLDQDPQTLNTNDCDEILKHYDYDQAAAIMAVIGRGGSKGPIIAAVDNSNGLMLVDFEKANSKDTSATIQNWFDSAVKNDGDDEIKSVTLWTRIVGALCDITKSNVSNLPSTTPDPSKIASYAKLVNNFRPIKLAEMAGIVVGRTFDAIACPKTQTAASKTVPAAQVAVAGKP